MKKSEEVSYCIINSVTEYYEVRNENKFFVLCPQYTLNIFEQDIIVDNFAVLYTRKFLDKHLTKESFRMLNKDLVSKQIVKKYVLEPKENVPKEMFLEALSNEVSKKQDLSDVLLVTENLYRDLVSKFTLEEKKRRELFRNQLLNKIETAEILKSVKFTTYDKQRLIKIKGDNVTPEIKLRQKSKYSILCPVYNDVENAAQFIKMLENIDYPRNLFEVILVNDGSTDNPKIIEDCAKKSPVDIKFINIAHSGVSIARNTALNHAKNEYVLFTDFDDILSPNILSECNSFFMTYPKVNVLCNPIYLVSENKRTLHNLSKLKYNSRIRFSIFDLESQHHLYLSNVAGTAIKRNLVKKIKFTENLNFFEDTSWINNLVNLRKVTKYGFANEAFYEYKITSDTSLSNKRHENQEQIKLLLNEYIYALSNYTAKASIIATLKSLNWFMGDALNSVNRKLDSENLELFRRLASLITEEHFEHLVGERVISAIQMLQGLNGKLYQEYQTRDYKIKYYVFSDLSKCENPRFINELSLFDVSIGYEVKVYEPVTQNIKRPINSILFMDKIFMADDNAYYLYKYLMENTKLKMYFVLSDRSEHWERLKAENFNLVKYGSQEYKDLIVSVDCIMSSHVDKFIIDYAGLRNEISNQTFVFLQHGVTNNDGKYWLFNKKIDYICSTFDFETGLVNEYFDMSQIIDCGMPRLDYLKAGSKKYITYFTSWSSYLQNLSDEKFKKSGFFKRIVTILTSDSLKKIAQDQNLSIEVKVHPNIEQKVVKNLEEYNISISKREYNELISQSYIAITDFSSVIFDTLYTTNHVYFYNDNYHEYFCEKKIQQTLSYDDFVIKRITNIDQINKLMKEEKRALLSDNNCEKLCEKLGLE